MKRTFEIWISESQSAMFIKDAKGWRENLAPDSKLLQTFEAESRFEAFQTYHALMGWSEWKAPERAVDLRFTGDDRHDFG